MIQNKTMLAVIALLVMPGFCMAGIVFQQDFESISPFETNDWWHVTTVIGGVGTITEAAWGVQSVNGSEALVFDVDSSGMAAGWGLGWFAAFGRTDIAVAPIGQAAENVTLSLDLAVSGVNNTTPVTLKVSQWNGDDHTTFSWSSEWHPTLTTNGDFTTVNVTLDTGTQSGTYNPANNLNVSLSFVGTGSVGLEGSGFGFDAGNRVIIDNVSLDVIPEPASASMVAFIGIGMFYIRRRFNR